MQNRTGLIMFFIIFWATCFAGTWYVLWRLFSFWGLRHGLLFWVVAVALSAGYIGASILDHNVPSFLSRLLMRLFAFWLGLGLISLSILAIHDLLHLLIRFPVPVSRWVAVGLIAAVTLYSVINAHLLHVRTLDLAAPAHLDLVQISDVHLGSIGRAHLARIVRRVNALEPDVVVITGDLMDSGSAVTAEGLAPLNDLTAPVYWVTGNHERYLGLNRAMAMLATTKVIPLRNEQVILDGIQLIGIDDSGRSDQIARVLDTIGPVEDKYRVLLYHRPESLEDAAAAGIDLMLCGHTHNGQIIPFHWAVRLQFDYLRGVHRLGPTTLNVSTGTGYWGPPMRLGSRAEIIRIRLRP